MSINKRLIEFVLHDDANKFKTVLKEEITNRIVDSIHKVSLHERKTALTHIVTKKSDEELEPAKENTANFLPENVYQLKDGNVGILSSKEQQNISKLYENLNKDNRERMVKLLSESKESFNRILRLAKLENKRTNNE